MDKDRNRVTEKILKLTLEIIYLLTGEDYAPVNDTTLHVTRSGVSRKSGRSCGSLTMDDCSSQKEERNNDGKILELTNKMIQLLTREVPIRYEDITVSFSMEEWEYIEGHRDQYQDVMMDDESLDSSKDLDGVDAEVENDRVPPPPPRLQAKAARKASTWRKPRKRRTNYITKRKGALETTTRDEKSPEDSTIQNGSSTKEDGNFTSDITDSDTITHNPHSPSEIKPDNDESYPPNDQYTACRTEQQLSPTEETVDLKPGPPEFSSCSPEPPRTTTSSTQEHYPYTPIKEETVPPEAEPTQYPSTHDQEESWQKTNDTGANIYAVGPTRYAPAPIKEESVFSEEESENSFLYIPPDRRYTPEQVKVEPISRQEGYEIYIPTDCAPRLHTAAPGHAMNRAKDAEKTSKRFSVSKYRDWNKPPDNAPRTNRQTAQVIDGMYVCSTCEKSFTSHFGLVKHQAIHNGNKVSCPQCGKLFFYKSSLVIHQRIHTGEKLFTCHVCNKCFTNNSNLVVHQRIHTGEKPFVCSECGKRFGHKGHLNRHLRTHETERPATTIENYVNGSLHNHWSAHKINGWSRNIYNAGPYSMYDKSV